MIKSKKQMLLVITLFTLLLIVGGVTYSFFNYTRTGSGNTLKVGRISFNSTQDNTISLTNVFPTSSTNLNSTNSDTVTINITGDTTYSEGIEYKVTLDQVNNTINGKEVPISIKATATNLGTEDSNYYNNRTNKTKIYLLNEEGEAYNGKYIAVGYIPAGSTGVNGSIDITAFIDTNKVAISDTYNGTESDLMGTTNDWVKGREVFTTTEWNGFTSTPLSFKVRVEANEGIWVEKEKFLTMKNFTSVSNWNGIRANITSIEFHKNGIAPENYITSIDVTDESSDPDKGNITLYTIDDGLGTNTYKAIVVANGTIYAPENSQGLFMQMTNLTTFNSKNFKVDNVTTMYVMFGRCPNLQKIDSLSTWNTSNVTNMNMMFRECINLIDISALSNWNVSSVTNMQQLFVKCTNLRNISGLSNWNLLNVKNMQQLFSECEKLNDISSISNWNTSSVTNMGAMFSYCTNLNNIDSLSNWNVSNVTNMSGMFASCSNLNDASGINDWNINESANFTYMFNLTPVHPVFTKFPNGIWDSNGTFSPNA